MKKKVLWFVVFALVIFALPYAVSLFFNLPKEEKEDMPSDSISFRVLDEGTGDILELSSAEFIFGAILAEMRPEYSSEALKAFAVAAFTSALREKLQNNGNEEQPDFSVNTAQFLRYTTKEQCAAAYGARTAAFFNAAESAAKNVAGEVILDNDGNVIAAAYHEISPGSTESAENIFDQHVSYLTATDSSFDKTSAFFEVKTDFSTQQIEEAMRKEYPDFAIDGAFEILEKTNSGTVKKLKIGATELTGKDLRRLLGLRSSAFSIEKKENGDFAFTTFGAGHGAGLSLYGADYLALQGKTYLEILSYYYNGIEVVRLSSD